MPKNGVFEVEKMQYMSYMSKELSRLVLRFEEVSAKLQVLDLAMQVNARQGLANNRVRRGYCEILSDCVAGFDLVRCDLSAFSECLGEGRIYDSP